MDNMNNYASGFSARYGSNPMRELWSDDVKHRAYRRIWHALAKAQHTYGMVSDDQLADIYKHMIPTQGELAEIEKTDRTIKHDVTAALRSYKSAADIGGGKLHQGGTSRDVTDNADMIRIREATDIIQTRLANILQSYEPLIREHANMPCISWTHYQPAGVITVGYRLANWAQGLLIALENLENVKTLMKGKGAKGIDGSCFGYMKLLEDRASHDEMEEVFLEELGIGAYPVTTQVYPRIVDYLTLTALAAIDGVSAKFAADIRLLTSPVFSEMGKEPEKDKVGSSDAPWKIYNPTNAERMNALAALVASYPNTAWINVFTDPFEGAVQDSANRRIIIPEGFLATDELLMNYDLILSNMGFWEGIKKNLSNYGSFMGIRELIVEAAKKGANRTDVHERITSYHVMPALLEFRATGNNPLGERLASDELLLKYLTSDEIRRIMDPAKDPGRYAGECSKATLAFLERDLRPALERNRDRLDQHVFPEF